MLFIVPLPWLRYIFILRYLFLGLRATGSKNEDPNFRIYKNKGVGFHNVNKLSFSTIPGNNEKLA